MRQRHEVLDEVERLYRCPPGESVIHGWQERDDLSRLLLSSKSATGYRGCSSPPRARRAIAACTLSLARRGTGRRTASPFGWTLSCPIA